MEHKNTRWLLIISLLLISWASSIAYIQYQYESQTDRLEMYYVERFNKTYNGQIPNGLYFSKGFTCIYFKDREYYDVLETFNHEWAHYTSTREHFIKTTEE